MGIFGLLGLSFGVLLVAFIVMVWTLMFLVVPVVFVGRYTYRSVVRTKNYLVQSVPKLSPAYQGIGA